MTIVLHEWNAFRVLIVAAAALAFGCGILEEKPEQAAWRAERARQATLPIAQASCGELGRRGRALERAIDREVRRQADHEEYNLPGVLRMPLSPPPRSMASEYATLGAIVAEMARRCPAA